MPTTSHEAISGVNPLDTSCQIVDTERTSPHRIPANARAVDLRHTRVFLCYGVIAGDEGRIDFFPGGVTSLSGHTTVRISATPIPIDTSANRCKATCQAGPDRGTNITIASVTPPNRYALRSGYTTAESNPRTNTLAANTSICDPK